MTESKRKKFGELRKMAEQRLEGSARGGKERSGDILELFHELEIH